MYIEINNTRIFYIKQGEGEPIILTHGNSESHEIFDETIRNLSRFYTVYALDTRGHGASDKIAELHYADMADDVIAFMHELNIVKPYYFGFSDGGIVGLIACVKSPNIFKKMLIAGANSHPKAMKKRWYFLFKMWYFFSRNKLLKVMFCEPNITAKQLQKISVKTVITMGQRDCITCSDGKFIADNLQNAKLLVLEKESHASYVCNNTKLTKLIMEHLLNE